MQYLSWRKCLVVGWTASYLLKFGCIWVVCLLYLRVAEPWCQASFHKVCFHWAAASACKADHTIFFPANCCLASNTAVFATHSTVISYAYYELLRIENCTEPSWLVLMSLKATAWSKENFIVIIDGTRFPCCINSQLSACRDLYPSRSIWRDLCSKDCPPLGVREILEGLHLDGRMLRPDGKFLGKKTLLYFFWLEIPRLAFADFQLGVSLPGFLYVSWSWNTYPYDLHPAAKWRASLLPKSHWISWQSPGL